MTPTLTPTTDTPTRRRTRRLAVAITLALAAAVALAVMVFEPSSSVGRAVSSVTAGPLSSIGEDDGKIGDVPLDVRTDADRPAIENLDPDLRKALWRATADAEVDGIRVGVTSGWRSQAYQERLLKDATRTYGSRAEARRWVATPSGSSHVTGDAVDVGPTDAAYWMQQHGSAYGLCQAYGNEIWHYELLTRPGGDCPAPRADGASRQHSADGAS